MTFNRFYTPFHLLFIVYIFVHFTDAIELPFPQDDENCRIFKNSLPTSLFSELKDSLHDISRKFHKEVEVGTFWYNFNDKPSNIIEETIVILRSELAQLDHEWIGAEW